MICKLYKAGIRGKILRLIGNYISDRKFRIVVNSYTSNWINSNIGAPQGGILSTALTNVYSSDSDECDIYSHGEYSDDNLKWERDVCELEALRKLQPKIDMFLKWCKDNNIGYSMDKVKLMVFRPSSSPRPF